LLLLPPFLREQLQQQLTRESTTKERKEEMKTTFQVGSYTCEMTFHPLGDVAAVWSPDVPRKLSKKEWAQYRGGRDAFMMKIAAAEGITGAMAVVE
jgi:hypothetical protein